MPTKHIDDNTWRKVEKAAVDAVLATRTHFKETEILKLLISKGLENTTEEDYAALAAKKNKS